MIEILAAQDNAHNAGSERKFFKMKSADPERMGGSIPVWGKAETFKEEVMQRIATSGEQPANFENALALQSTDEGSYIKEGTDEFGFGDIIDMVNPLQHIPVVGHIYREVTGDQIKPISRILGGAVFGGPAGAAGGLVNVIAEEETGGDLTDNAMALMLDGQTPQFKSQAPLSDDPVKRLDNTVKSIAEGQDNDFPASLLAFTETSHNGNSRQKKTVQEYDQPVLQTINSQEKREPITIITLSGLPKHRDLNP